MSESVGRWSTTEHKVFVLGCERHGKDWKAIADMVGTRTVVQTRTHAQKFFQKKNARDYNSKLGILGDDDDGDELGWSQREPGNVSVLGTDAEGGSVSTDSTDTTGSQYSNNGNKGGHNGLKSPAKKRKTGAARQKAAKPPKSKEVPKSIAFDTVNSTDSSAIPFLEETFFLDDEDLERGREEEEEEEEFASACDLICTPAEICISHESEAHCPLFQSFTKDIQSGAITPPLILCSLSPPSPATDNEASPLIMGRANKKHSISSESNSNSNSNSNSLIFTFANVNSGLPGGSTGEWVDSRTTSSSSGGILSSVETMSVATNESVCNDNYSNNLCLMFPAEVEMFPSLPPQSVSPRLRSGMGKQTFRNRTDTFDSSVTSSSAQSPASSVGSLSPRFSRTSLSRSGTFGSSDGLCATSTDDLSLLPMTLKLTLKAQGVVGGSGTSPAQVAKKRGRPRKYPIQELGEEAPHLTKSTSLTSSFSSSFSSSSSSFSSSRLVICESDPPLSLSPLVVCEPGPSLSMSVAALPDMMSDTALLFPSESLDDDTFFLGNEGFSLI